MIRGGSNLSPLTMSWYKLEEAPESRLWYLRATTALFEGAGDASTFIYFL